MSSSPDKNKRLVVRDTYERIVFGEVYRPGFIDSHGTTMTANEIKRVAYDFMKKGYVNRIDEQHSWKESGCYVIESFIARENDPDEFYAGSWVLGTQIVGDAIWDKVLRGEYNGYSIAGFSDETKTYVDLTRTTELDVETELNLSESMDKHSHVIHIVFDEDGKVIPTWSSEAMRHVHEVLLSTATEIELDHSHRFTCSCGVVNE